MGDHFEVPDTLELIIAPNVRVKVADILISEPIEQDGAKFQTITLTIPFRAIELGTRLTVVDGAADGKVFCVFMPERVKMVMRGEAFVRVDGRHFIRFANSI